MPRDVRKAMNRIARKVADEFGAQAEEKGSANRASEGLRDLFAMHMPGDEALLRGAAMNGSGENVLI